MVNTVWPANAVVGSPSYGGRSIRQTLMSVFGRGATAARPLGGRSGVRPGTPTSTVTATSTTWTVQPHAGMLDVQAAAEAGMYGYAIDAAVTGPVTAANATNPRIDIIYVQLSDPAEGDGTAAPGVQILYLAGTAAASPVQPTLPARSMLLARINVPAAGGGSPTVTFLAPFLQTGIWPVRDSAERSNVGTFASGSNPLFVFRSDASSVGGLEYTLNGTAWIPASAVPATSMVVSAGPSGASTPGTTYTWGGFPNVVQGTGATYTAANGNVSLSLTGMYHIAISQRSGGSPNGGARVAVSWPSGPSSAVGLEDIRHRCGNSYTNGDTLVQPLTWTGYVSAPTAFTVQSNVYGTACDFLSRSITVTYLGG